MNMHLYIINIQVDRLKTIQIYAIVLFILNNINVVYTKDINFKIEYVVKKLLS